METLYPNSSSCFSSNPRGSGKELLLSRQILSSSSSEWSKEENKLFEKALAIYDKETPDRWWNIANMAGRSMEDVIAKYTELLHDVTDIEAGRFTLPFDGSINSSSSSSSCRDYDYGYRKKPSSASVSVRGGGGGGSSDQEIRKKGIPWTEDEHRRFLKGLMKYGKGDWRNISRNFVFTKTPTQVASHAQKYFIRQQQQQQLCDSKDHHNNKRRPSIHDITTNNLMSTQSQFNNNNTIFDHLNTDPLQQSPPNYNNYWMSSSSDAGWNWLEERALRIFRANYQAAAATATATATATNYDDITTAAAAAAAAASSKMQLQENVDLHLPSSLSDNTPTLLGIQSTSNSFRIYG